MELPGNTIIKRKSQSKQKEKELLDDLLHQLEADQSTEEVETLMKLYGLNELIKDSNKFVLEQKAKKKALKKDEFKQVLSIVLNDPDKVEKIYETANEVAEEVIVEKLKCLKYKGK